MNPADAQAIAPDAFTEQLNHLLHQQRPHYRRLWAYYRNSLMPLTGAPGGDADRPYRQAQEWGLPPRITGARAAGSPDEIDLRARKEIVIENDIGWRIDTMVDYLFGKPIVIDSEAPDPQRAALIAQLLRLIFAANGGIQFLQQLALIGSVYGFVDVLVKYIEPTADPAATDPTGTDLSATCATRPFGAPVRGGLAGRDEPAPHRLEPTPSPAGAPHAGPAPTTAPTTPPTPSPDASDPDPGSRPHAHDASPSSSITDCLQRIARSIRFEIVEPARALPLLCPTDARKVTLYAQVYALPRPAGHNRREAGEVHSALARRRPSLWKRLQRSTAALFTTTANLPEPKDDAIQVVDVITPAHWARFEDGRPTAGGNNALGQIPLVHIQNIAMPFTYAGAGDVEPLIALQDELNTRLSDRANRITLQSFRMYLGKGIEDFTSQTIAPGRMWKTDNPEAEIVTFGGDDAAPSEDAHLADVREAIDKASGVTPIAAGAIKGRIGRLTSAAALRITLLALLAKNDRKRTTYGHAIERLCELALAWLNVADVFPTRPDERAVNIHWPSPLPENVLEKLQEAEAKSRLGIPRDVILRELGY